MLKLITPSLIISCLVALSLLTAAPVKAQNDQYRLGAGDLIRITVFEEQDLSFDDLLVGDGGMISYPFLDQIKVEGKTTKQLEQKIIDGLLGDYLIDPKVTVSIIEYRNFYVNGEVKKPGGFPFKPGLTIRKAISLAGGLTNRASTNKIFVVHDNDSEQKSAKVTLNSYVRPGDSITIDQSFF
jgi:polysaccharide export outer membrane protein